ncbi:MAG: HNH endonuclease signature motif containing protein [Bacteroidota bacterium]
MAKKEYPEEFLDLIKSITNKRAKIVIDHILKHGHISTEEIEKTYGYNHPPRAARDVREAGIPLETFRVKSTEDKSIAAYRFGDLTKIRKDRLKGRQIFSKQFKQNLYNANSGKCYICDGKFEIRYLQVDHRVPYEISGDENNFQQDEKDYMLLCISCNRAKSWSCESCENWTSAKDIEICLKCYWGKPENYDHIALKKIRRLEIVWQGKEVEFFEALNSEAEKGAVALPNYIKSLLKQYLNKKK